jgi:3-oxoacyl-[acyl-carrier protein] reductase
VGTPESRVMVLTGAASGIGRHLAGRLAREGHRVVATDIEETKLVEAARADGWPEARVLCRKQDVRDAAAWPEVIDLAFRTWGRLDVLLNVAGFLRPSVAWLGTAEDVDRHLDVNTKGVIHCTRAAAERMVAQGHGHIVNVASLAAHCPVPGLALYAASKFAVRGYSLSAAFELHAHNVQVSVVCPDAVQTPMLDLQVRYPEAAISFSNPKALTVEDVGRVIVGRVLAKRPLEVLLPRHRGWIARAAGLWPGLGMRMAPFFIKRGAERQKSLRGEA